uniref:Expressed protein n=1 Tax=Schizophyllum commune (strain H4-8 / FGSC 9210) TaxID=578458 RepID=D8PS93_SCHCM
MTAPAPNSQASDRPPSPARSGDAHRCQWVDCTLDFSDPEVLYNHLCNDHIGRKSTNNLCLTCKWKDCTVTCAKRDHITSHMRVHTPLKPHICEICKKSFKRPQDLKKHEKIHTEEHHQQHKHSKAITVQDPAYVSRVRGSSVSRAPEDYSSKHLDVPSARMPSSRSSSDGGSHYVHTPSPEITSPMDHRDHHRRSHSHHTPPSHMFMPNDSLPQWEVLRPEAHASAGQKRSHDFMDDFFTDMKKRRVSPSYDPRMAERLNQLAAYQSQDVGFNPRSVSFDIRTPEELSAVNEFLVTLGRSVAARTVPISQQQQQQQQQHMAQQQAPALDDFTADLFDTASLNQLGLAGLPGMPPPSPPNHFATSNGQGMHRSSMSSSSSGYSVYPNLEDAFPIPPMPDYQHAPISHHSNSRRASASKYSNMGGYGNYQHQPTPPLEISSPHSSVSTPLTSTPPHLPEHQHLPDHQLLADFDYLRPTRGPAPAAHLAADYAAAGKAMRTIVPLKSVPPARPATRDAAEVQEAPADRTSRRSVSPGPRSGGFSRLYPLLTSGDADLKLPPLASRGEGREQGVSLPSIRDLSSSTRGSPGRAYPRLSDVDAGRAGGSGSTPGPEKRASSEELARDMGRIDLKAGENSVADKRRHAMLIRELLVSINEQYKRRLAEERERERIVEDESDVEMRTPRSEQLEIDELEASPMVRPRDVEMLAA